MPLWWQVVLSAGWAQKRDLTALSILRSLLISLVAAEMPTEDMEAASSSSSAAAIWESVREDAAEVSDGEVPWVLPLWGDATNPFAGVWQEVQAKVHASETAGNWQFWIDWYQALLDGRPMLGDAARTWQMLEKVALIAPEDWAQKPEVVNPMIAGIWGSIKSVPTQTNP